MKRVLILFIMLFQFSCSNNKIGYYEPKGDIYDENVYKKFNSIEYNLIKEGFTEQQLLDINKVLVDKNLHLNSDLGTCEISGVIVLKDKIIYLTCGTAQLFVINNNGVVEPILLNTNGNKQLFELISEIKQK